MSTLTKLFAVGAAAALALPAFAPVAFADNSGTDARPAAGNSGYARGGEYGAGSTTSETAQNNQGDNNATSTGESNRSEVATRVQALLSIANRDGGIGAEVRTIAHDYASSTDKIDTAKAEVDGRPGWMTFLIGSDYKNLGAIRSELSTTQNSINRLTSARDRATDPTVKADLTAQVTALTNSASTTDAFVTAHENSFSLFGWFFHAFNR